MSRYSVFVKREKTLAEQIIIVVLLGLLMAGFLLNFLQQAPKFTQVGFDTVAGHFATKVSTIRAQWFMDKQPTIVLVKEQGKQQTIRKIIVNKRGWVDTKTGQNDCVFIWQQVMDSPLEFMNKPIATLQINQNSVKDKRICRYMLASGEYFQYDPANGKVSNVLIVNDL